MPSAATPAKPTIAVSASADSDLDGAGLYASAVERNGGEAWTLTPENPVSPDEFLRRAHGLVLAGGEDISPSLYGESERADVEYMAIDPARDAMELALTRAALDADMPIYGICRGMQMLNVAMGGRLAHHVENHDVIGPADNWKASYHRIYISPGSKLAAVVGSGGFVRVNSLHHQGVREAHKSPRLLASAYSLEDGVIEALESPSHRWAIAVQFHPERRMEIPPHFERLFQSLSERAAERMMGMGGR